MTSVSISPASFACGFLPSAVCSLLAPNVLTNSESSCVGDQCLAAALGSSSESFTSAKLSCSAALVTTVTPTAPTVYVTEIAVATEIDTIVQYVTSYATISAFTTETNGLVTTVTVKDVVATETDYVTASSSQFAKRQGQSSCQGDHVSPVVNSSTRSFNSSAGATDRDNNSPSSTSKDQIVGNITNITSTQTSLFTSIVYALQPQSLDTTFATDDSASQTASPAATRSYDALSTSSPSLICACQATVTVFLVPNYSFSPAEQSELSTSTSGASPAATGFTISATPTKAQTLESPSSLSSPTGVAMAQMTTGTLPTKPSTSVRFANTSSTLSIPQSSVSSQTYQSTSDVQDTITVTTMIVSNPQSTYVLATTSSVIQHQSISPSGETSSVPTPTGSSWSSTSTIVTTSPALSVSTTTSAITSSTSTVSSANSSSAHTSCAPGSQTSICSCLGVTPSTVTASVSPVTLTLPATSIVTVQATKTGISVFNTTVGVTRTATTFSTATVTDRVTSTVDVTITPSATICAPLVKTPCANAAKSTFVLKASSSDSSVNGKYIQLVDSNDAEVDQGSEQHPVFTSNRCLASSFNINSEKHLGDTKGFFANSPPYATDKIQFYLDDVATVETFGNDFYSCALLADGTLDCQVNGLTQFAYCPMDQQDFGIGLVLANVDNGLDPDCTPVTINYEMISCGA